MTLLENLLGHLLGHDTRTKNFGSRLHIKENQK